jgi:adenylate cyclase
MKEPLNRTASALFGDARRYTLEHRLFNTISLLNGVTNIGGAFAAFGETNYQFLFGLHLATGLLFLLYYYLSRLRGLYRSLYWPFVLSIAAFLFLNTLVNAGSHGGAHYYFVPALVIAVVLARNLMTTVVAASLFIAAAAGLFFLERAHPEWITAHARASERFADVLGNFLFVQVLTGALVMVLAKNLNLERAKSDVLLLNVLPESIAEELKAHERVAPRQYECASVLFTDFAGFTRIAEKLTPQELIEGLDECFRAFDTIAKKHKLEKIKTIGDAYLAVGGIPSANRTHAVDAVLAALEMQRFISERADEPGARDGVWWRLRVGVHTGPVVAGVIGREKFAYDVWGDTVNTASRLESSGAEGRVNISGATYGLVKDYFDCEYRGRVSAKNKGEIEMYFVNGARPQLQDGKFLEMYRRLSEESSPS